MGSGPTLTALGEEVSYSSIRKSVLPAEPSAYRRETPPTPAICTELLLANGICKSMLAVLAAAPEGFIPSLMNWLKSVLELSMTVEVTNKPSCGRITKSPPLKVRGWWKKSL